LLTVFGSESQDAHGRGRSLYPLRLNLAINIAVEISDSAPFDLSFFKLLLESDISNVIYERIERERARLLFIRQDSGAVARIPVGWRGRPGDPCRGVVRIDFSDERATPDRGHAMLRCDEPLFVHADDRLSAGGQHVVLS